MTALPPLPQERRVVTAIPGPKSQELQARRVAAVAAGVGSVLPVFTARAGGGIIEDVDGNQLIDFGSGIAVTSVGASAEAVVRRATAQLQDFTHTCFMVTPYEGYVAVAEALAELTPGDHAKTGWGLRALRGARESWLVAQFPAPLRGASGGSATLGLT